MNIFEVIDAAISEQIAKWKRERDALAANADKIAQLDVLIAEARAEQTTMRARKPQG